VLFLFTPSQGFVESAAANSNTGGALFNEGAGAMLARACQNVGDCSGGTVKSASRIIKTSPRAASNAVKTASALPFPG
jgi:hypothetical protein